MTGHGVYNTVVQQVMAAQIQRLVIPSIMVSSTRYTMLRDNLSATSEMNHYFDTAPSEIIISNITPTQRVAVAMYISKMQQLQHYTTILRTNLTLRH